MKWLKRILIGILIVIGVILLFGLMLPSEYVIDRSVVVNTEPIYVAWFVDDLQQWPNWMPWYEMDPTIQVKYDERTKGVGARQTWTGDSGNGEVAITKSGVTGIEYTMDLAGLVSESKINYEAVGDGTRIKWHMEGDVGARIHYRYALLFGMREGIGALFDQGLNNLKTLAETPLVEEEPTEEAEETSE